MVQKNDTLVIGGRKFTSRLMVGHVRGNRGVEVARPADGVGHWRAAVKCRDNRKSCPPDF